MILTPNIRFFVSFSSLDMKYVREIMAALKGQQLEVWDYSNIIEGIEAGRNIPEKLTQEIDACTHMIVIISKNSLNLETGHFCRFELEYALNRKTGNDPYFMPVVIESEDKPVFTPPYDIFINSLYLELDVSAESIVKFTVQVCQLVGKVYIPPIEAHPNLPFWKLFRKEVEEMAHSNNEHVDIMMILGLFNEHYRKSEMPMALFMIQHFMNTCFLKVKKYKPFYPLIVKAVCETELELYDEALKSYEKAKCIHPENQDVIGGMGSVFFKTGQYQKAVECFEQIIIRNNKNDNIDNARINLIITKIGIGNDISLADAEFLLNFEAKGYAPDLRTAILNAKGIYHKTKKNYPALRKICENLIAQDLYDTISIILYSLYYIDTGFVAKGRSMIEQAIHESGTNKRLDKNKLTKYLIDNLS